MSKPTLVILAAGMASRYGSMKQIAGFGPNNETIMDYSIFDAIRAGFGKVVFIIREDFAENFKANGVKKFLLGANYREEWGTPIKVKVFDIDKVLGGLKPLRRGGGHQSRSLRLEETLVGFGSNRRSAVAPESRGTSFAETPGGALRFPVRARGRHHSCRGKQPHP